MNNRTIVAAIACVLGFSLVSCSDLATAPPPSRTDGVTARPTGLPTTVPDATLTSLDSQVAFAVAERYETALTSGDPATAWELLAPGALRPETYGDFVRSAAAWLTAPYRRFVVLPATRDPTVIATWFDASLETDLLAQHADHLRAYVVPVRHPDVAGASAGSETLVVAPLADGSWRIWRAH